MGEGRSGKGEGLGWSGKREWSEVKKKGGRSGTGLEWKGGAGVEEGRARAESF